MNIADRDAMIRLRASLEYEVSMMERKKAKRAFFSGYGEGYISVPKVVIPPEIQQANKKTWLLMKYYFVLGCLLALSLPNDILSMSPLLTSYADLMAKLIPFIDWATHESFMPQVIRLWYAVMWPALLILPVRYMTLYAYRYLPGMARKVGIGKHVFAVAAGALGCWMFYVLMISATHMPVKSYSMGHGRATLALITDYRMGLALFSPALMLCQFVIFQSAVMLTLALFARFVKRKDLP